VKLADLNPRWYVAKEGGPDVGLTFDCPCCGGKVRLAVPFHADGADMDPEPEVPNGFAAPPYVWTLHSSQDFATLTLTPSVDASKAGHWHGFITDGEIR
jgi:hypothetical protein